MMFKLAELYYSVPGLANRLENQTVNLVMKPKEYDLMADVAAGALDLAFTYKSLALQFKVDYVALPPQINLGNVEYEDLYNKAEVFAMGKKRTGTTIMYALTIPNLARNKDWATRFILFLLGDEGREILRENFQDPIVPPTARGDLMSMPDELRKICEVK
jgi:molybdate/tungstate transport system substrate-binding protein